MRLYLGNQLGLRNPNEFKPLWVLDFPLFEYAEEENRWVARHHPFTSPKPSQIQTMIDNDPVIHDAANYLSHPYAQIKANAALARLQAFDGRLSPVSADAALYQLFLQCECLCPDAFPVTIGCTDSPRLLRFGGIRRSQWMVS